MNTQLDTVRAQATEVMQTQVALLTQVAYANSDDSVEQWAYTNKWVRVDENPISIVPLGDVTPTPVPSPVSQTTDLPKWRLWLELFFGKRQKNRMKIRFFYARRGEIQDATATTPFLFCLAKCSARLARSINSARLGVSAVNSATPTETVTLSSP
jgi:hypothetical protein